MNLKAGFIITAFIIAGSAGLFFLKPSAPAGLNQTNYQAGAAAALLKRLAAESGRPLESRSLELGQPEFIQNKSKRFSELEKQIKNQWALQNISILKAWELLEKKKANRPVVVAVIDTGIHAEHPCLKNKLWTNPGEIPNNGIDDEGNGFIDDIHGWNFADNNNDIQDRHGHGTHVSGIIAAQGKSPESPNCRVFGVSPQARIMTLKYFSETGSDSSNIKNTILSIKYAVQNGADIINYSGGGPGANIDEQSAIAKAADKNIIFVAALGNDGSKVEGKKRSSSVGPGFERAIKYFPASYELPNILSVQSYNKENEIIESSNHVQVKYWEEKKAQAAPGYEIISTLPPRRYFQGQLFNKAFRLLAGSRLSHNNYGKMTGTSQATAVAAGVIALVKSLYPSWSMEKLINQAAKTGVGRGTEKIKELTNEGKKIDAYEALIMRDSGLDQADQIDYTNAYVPHDPDNPEKSAGELARPMGSRSSAAHDSQNGGESQKRDSKNNLLEILEAAKKRLSKDKK